jgi:hypothetical protein
MHNSLKKLSWWSALLGLVLATTAFSTRAIAQDDNQQQDDPPSRVARLGYMEGSVSFEPSGEQDWVGATDNRPLTIGDKLWSDKGSRAELQLGSAVIRLGENTGISFLNLDDRTVQVQLSSGAINIRVRRLENGEAFEIDTPNLAFSIYQPGSYRVEASEDGSNTAVTVREGEGEATGNGQSYKIHAGQRTTFSGAEQLEADTEQIAQPDQFDTWAEGRDHRWENSRSSHYVSPDVVGYDDLDDNGDWRDEGDYGHVWYPHVEVGWAPYRNGHWAWIDPWGYTWVDDAPWGYAPFHYGRWVSVGGRWGWVAGPVAVRAVYAPALVVFVGGSGGWGGNIGWFPLGPREVYVPSYQVSRAYVERVNISNTTVNNTTITNVYNTTIVNKTTTNITNVTYVNRNVQGGMTAVPQHAFASAQPVSRAAVAVNAEQMRAAPVSARVAVNPTREAVLGAKAATANRVTAPPAAVMNRQVIAKQAPPPPPPTFAARQQAMQAHPGQPLPRQEVARMAPAASAAASHPAVKVAPPAKPATPTTGHPATNQPANNQPANNGARPGQPAPGTPGNQPANRPAAFERPGAPAAQPNNRPQPNQPENRPPAAQPNNRPQPNQPENRPPAAQPNNRPQPNQPENRPPAAQPNNRPNQPENRPPAAQPNNRPAPPENRQPAAQPNNRPAPPENRPPAAQPNNRPNQPENRPPAAQPENRPPAAQPNNRPAPPENRPPAAQPNNRPTQPENRPPAAQPNNHPAPQENRPPAAAERPPQRTPPPAAERQAPPPQKQQPPPKQQTPEEKKRAEEKKPPGA